jgi:hypothetical protein
MDRDDERRRAEERKLAQLIINNPELEVLCLCDEECGGEDRAVGEIAHSMIDAYTLGTNCYGEERYYFKSDTSDPKKADDLTYDDVEFPEKIFGENEVDEMTDEEMVENYQNIEWTACIRVRIAPV